MHNTRFKILIVAILMEGAALLLALLMAGYFNLNLFPLTDNLLRDILYGTIGAIPPFILFLFTVSSKAAKISLFGSLRKTLISDVKKIFFYTNVYDLIFISLLAGIAEEILFRGVVQERFGIVIASAVFGLVHCVSPAYVVVTAIMGLYIGALFILSGNLLVPIHLHFIYDLGALVYLKYFVNAEPEN
jgi:membrane protease YdiL (CAAX protease family)